MCGIFGIVSSKGDNCSKKTLESISALLNRRGPDHSGYAFYKTQENIIHYSETILEQFNTSDLLFLHKRLSILDLSPLGNQPMVDKTGRYALIFNGEIYNFLSLKSNLKQLGYTFNSNTDTEVLLYQLIHYGLEGIQQLEGMYTFAFFDKKLKRVIVARDPFGIKPCYIIKEKFFFAFSSTINALLALPCLNRPKLNFNTYVPFLRFGATDFKEETLVQGVNCLLPGHYIEIKFDNETLNYNCTKFFHLNKQSSGKILTLDECKTTLLDLLNHSVKQHLISDVPVCFNLSGGIDSSVLLAIASQFKKDITAFTYEADDDEICEAKYAEIVASHLGIRLEKIRIDPLNFGKDLEDIIIDQGEPYGGSSVYAQRKLYEAQKNSGFKVCIDGQGADELFAGYGYFLAYKLIDLIKTKRYDCLLKYLSTVGRMNTKVRLKGVIANWIDILLKPHPVLRFAFRKCIGKDLRPFYLNKQFYKKYSNDFDTTKFNSLQDALKDSLLYSNIPTLLRYADRNAMAFSIENRVPFLTTYIANFAHNLPSQFLVSDNGITKFVLRECAKGLLPKEILCRRDKLGFPPTEGLWMLKNYKKINEILHSDVASCIPGIDIKKLIQYWDNIIQVNNSNCFRSDIIWRIINLIKWVELFNMKCEN